MTLRTRLAQAELLAVAEVRLAAGQMQRRVAAATGVPRSTLRGWCRQVPRGEPPAGLAAFVLTPEGIAWLQRLVLAAHFSITLRAGGGTRLVSEYLELSGLSAICRRQRESGSEQPTENWTDWGPRVGLRWRKRRAVPVARDDRRRSRVRGTSANQVSMWSRMR